jgi:hypothetical protein
VQKSRVVNQAINAPVSFESNPHGLPHDSFAQIAPVISSIAKPAKARLAVLYIKPSSKSKLGNLSRSFPF